MRTGIVGRGASPTIVSFLDPHQGGNVVNVACDRRTTKPTARRQYAAASSSRTAGARDAGRRGLGVPVLEPAPGGPPSDLRGALGRRRHPALVFFVALMAAFALLAALSIAAGLLAHGRRRPRLGRRPGQQTFRPRGSPRHRTPARTEAR